MKPKIVNGVVVCPHCEKKGLIHSYSVSKVTGEFRVGEDGTIVAFGHKDNECHSEHVNCYECGLVEECNWDVDE